MKNNPILLILLSSLLSFTNYSLFANNNSVKFYPSALAIGKLHMCNDIRFGYEIKYKTHQNIEFGVQASLPHIVWMAISSMASIIGFIEYDQIPYVGAGGFVSYKYQFQNKRFYIGAGVFSSYYQSLVKLNTRNGFTGNDGYNGPENYHTKIYMNELNAKLGWIIESKNDLDIAFEIGYRYNRGYLVFADKKVEMPHDIKAAHLSYYSLLRFPLRLGIDLSINLSILHRNKKSNHRN